jgi:hypothetical protein
VTFHYTVTTECTENIQHYDGKYLATEPLVEGGTWFEGAEEDI